MENTENDEIENLKIEKQKKIEDIDKVTDKLVNSEIGKKFNGLNLRYHSKKMKEVVYGENSESYHTDEIQQCLEDLFYDMFKVLGKEVTIHVINGCNFEKEEYRERVMNIAKKVYEKLPK